MAEEITQMRAVQKKQLETYSADIKQVYEAGLALEEKIELFDEFSAMQEYLETTYQNFLSRWDALIESSIAAKLSFPSDSASKMYSDTKSWYFKARAAHKKYQTMVDEALRSKRESNSSQSDPQPSISNQSLNESRITRAYLPKIELPIFHGNIAEWPAFRDVFRSIILDDTSLQPIERFFFLIRALKGEALSVVSQFPLDGSNFQSAWEALSSAYDKKRVLASSYINKVIDFKSTATRPSVDSLQTYISGVIDNLSSFRNLKLDASEDFLLFSLAIRGLDPVTREAFEYRHAKDEFPTYEMLVTFVRERCTALQLSKGSLIPVAPAPSSSTRISKRTLLVSPNPVTPSTSKGTTSPSRCCVCSGSHELYQCPKFKALNPKERFNIVHDKRRCVNCLSALHSTIKCRSRTSCHLCSKRHHSLLHFTTPATRAESTTEPPAPVSSESSASGHVLSGFSSLSQPSQILLGTAIINLRASSGRIVQARAVLDSGSQYCFMTKDCASKLGLSLKYFHGRIAGLGDTLIAGRKGRVTCDITHDDHTFPDTQFIVVQEITGNLPAVTVDSKILHLFSSYTLADTTFWKSLPIDCLIGAQWFFKCLRGAPITIGENLPLVIPTVFGHIISGPVPISSLPSSACSLFTFSTEERLSHQLEKFWESEELGPDTALSTEDSLCIAHFNKTTARLPSGQYMVSLPFLSNPPTFHDSYSIALCRFLHMEHKFKKDPAFRQQYNDFMTEYLNLGHMELASEPGQYYIPHHAVFKQVGDAKKIRVVFDASCKMRNCSLNDSLMKGPRLQSDIQELLTRFRLHRVVFTTDIVKMYRAILLQPSDTAFTHILWRWSDSSPVQDFRLLTVTYGVRSSAFQAIATLMKLAEDEREHFPNAAAVLQRSIYVDDILTGHDTVDGASQLIRELIALLSKGGFSLSKWASNMPEILPADPEGNTKSLTPSDDDITKILGIEWDHFHDCFMYRISPPNIIYSKRGVLSAISRIYDPLGLISPAVFYAKHILQQLWKLELGWDAEIPADLAEAWRTWVEDLPALGDHRIARLIPIAEASSAQILGFADASIKGYSAVCYIRLESTSGVTVHLLKSKSKLAPIKPLTINRLELCAASLLIKVVNSLNFLLTDPKIDGIHLFSDSRVALAWINSSPHLIKTYVANRVREIQVNTPALATWHYISTAENPSDCCSRGLMPHQLINFDLWWSGPSWATLPLSEWPINAGLDPLSEIPEMKPVTLLATKPSPFINIIEKFSSLEKLLRVLAYIKRFISIKLKLEPIFKGPICLEEVMAAQTLACRLTQQHYWPDAFRSSGQTIPKSILSLTPIMDPSTRLLLVGGRLHNSSLAESIKHPILIPRESHLAKIIIDYYHLKYFHADATLLRSLINHTFWIPSIRCLIRSRISKCRRCYTLSKSPKPPLMSALPSHRVTPETRAFVHTAVDFAGPLLIRDSLRRKFTTSKAYLSIFVCMATKAIHVEVVSSLTSDAFIAALHRFISRRGRPSNFHSDRGSNFIGADNHCKEAFLWLHKLETQSVLETYLTKERISWTFHPPYAPHFSGLAESAVRLTKSTLHKVMGTTPFTFEELCTITVQIEAMLNSRPLCPLSEDIQDLNILSPGHFLIGAPLLAAPEKSLLPLKEGRLSRWQLVQQRSQHFWQRWSNEYLLTLQRRGKWTEETPNMKPGDMVLLTDEVTPPLKWPLARVSSVHPGKDGRVRVVTLKTSKGEFIRPVAKLISLSPLTENH